MPHCEIKKMLRRLIRISRTYIVSFNEIDVNVQARINNGLFNNNNNNFKGDISVYIKYIQIFK